jgi:hypothetical protein
MAVDRRRRSDSPSETAAEHEPQSIADVRGSVDGAGQGDPERVHGVTCIDKCLFMLADGYPEHAVATGEIEQFRHFCNAFERHGWRIAPGH